MKTNLYRGSMGNSNWVYGNLLIMGNRYFIAYINSHWFIDESDDELLTIENVKEITDINSVGQYIGRDDLKGKQIFEGDVLSIYNTYNHTHFHGVVAFIDGRYVITESGMIHDDWVVMDVEVVGNAIDGWR